MKLRLLSIVLLLALLSSGYVFAQDDNETNPLFQAGKKIIIYPGITAGWNKSMHSVTLKTFAKDNLCPSFEDGDDNGFFGGLTYEHFFGDAKTTNSSLIFKLMYSSLPASFEVGGDKMPSRVIVNGKEEIINSVTLNSNKVKYDLVSFNIFYKFNPIQGSGLGFIAGPSIDFAMKKTQDQRMDLIEPLNAQFSRDNPATAGYKYTNNDRTIIISEGDIPNSNAFRLGIAVGAQYEISMKNMYVVPFAVFNYGVTKLSSDEDWNVNALQIGVDVRFGWDIAPLLGLSN